MLRAAWFVVFVAGAVLSFAGHRRLGYGILGGGAVLIGVCLLTNMGGVQSDAVEHARRSRWTAPALANTTFFRLFALGFAVIGAIFLVLAVTNRIPVHTRH